VSGPGTVGAAKGHHRRGYGRGQEGVLRPASTRRFEPYFDRLYFHNIYTYHLLSWLGPYVRAGLETKILPRWQDYAQPRDVDEVDEGGMLVRTHYGVDRVQPGNPFAPLPLREGLGGNVRALHTLWVDRDLRIGGGARQYFPFGEMAKYTPATGPEQLKHVAGYHLEGVEGAIVGTARISRWVILSTELDGLMPFNAPDKTVFGWRSQLSLRLVSFASLNALLNVTRDPNRGAGLPITMYEQLFQLRFSYNIL